MKQDADFPHIFPPNGDDRPHVTWLYDFVFSFV